MVSSHRASSCRLFLPLLLAFITAVVYANSLSVPFLLDDKHLIVQNFSIRSWHSLPLLLKETRPFLNYTFAFNYLLGGMNVRGYHLLNLCIHIAAGFCFYAVVCRTLMRLGFKEQANWIAFWSILLWLVHPLQTASVTYLAQRSESLMGLLYGLSFYCAVRGFDSKQSFYWYLSAFLLGCLGVYTKEVIVTIGASVFFYDAIFVTQSFTLSFRKRFWLYAGFLGLFILLPPTLLLPTQGHFSAGLSLSTISPWQYLRTQPGVIWHYVRLFFWPIGLCFDYAWRIADQWQQIVLPAIPLVLMIITTVILVLKKNKAGYLAAFFLITLSPTSSVIPVADLAFEHRMYLPSLSLAVGLVMGLRFLAQRLFQSSAEQKKIQWVIVVAIALGLGWLTIQRNTVFQSREALWRDTIKKSPLNPRAYNNLGSALLLQGRADEALASFKKAIELDPQYAHPYINLGAVYTAAGKPAEAIDFYRKGLALNPKVRDANYNWANAAAELGHYDEAIAHYLQEFKFHPEHIKACNNLANLYSRLNQFQNAVTYYQKGIEIDPTYAKLRHNYGLLLTHLGRFDEAIEQYQAGLKANPQDADLYHGYAAVLERMGKVNEAIKAYSTAIALRPDFKQAQANLQQLLRRQSEPPDHV
ncbi:MAG: hypothetical protein COW12_08800 [Candidatus Omnitrophica bacterium CG12_big_fil_rev_8_21_14_0_65_45_16]|nr:MAG: hypothetical protein COW12_08800 [Candidatus Omnitrophica bacterium CG12_big_fil_rev_8_21_14_0_65_45_16]